MQGDYNETARRLLRAMSYADLQAVDLANKSGVAIASISQFTHARGRPSQKTAQKLGTALNVSPLWLLGYDVPMKDGDLSAISNLSTPAAKGLPILGEICAGNGIDCKENFDGLFFVDTSIKADYCLKVSGDSMTDANIYDGDIAFIRKADTFQRGCIYAVLVCGENTATLKRVYEQGDNLILNPCNLNYDPMIYRKDDVILIGECIGTFHRQKKDMTIGEVMSKKDGT